MSTTAKTMDRLEFFFIRVFKFTLLLALLAALGFAAYSLVRGVQSLSARPAAPPAPSAPPQARFDQSKLLQVLAPPPAIQKAANPTQPNDTSVAADDGMSLEERHLEALWPLVSAYQGECGTTPPLQKTQFVEGLRQTPLLTALRERGDDYAQGQLQFVKESLSNPQVVQLCKAGKSGIFLTVIEQHRDMWDAHRLALDAHAEAQAQERRQFEKFEAMRVEDEQAAGRQQLIAAVTAFAAFMGMALILVFARIEANLRHLRPGQDGPLSSSVRPPA